MVLKITNFRVFIEPVADLEKATFQRARSLQLPLRGIEIESKFSEACDLSRALSIELSELKSPTNEPETLYQLSVKGSNLLSCFSKIAFNCLILGLEFLVNSHGSRIYCYSYTSSLGLILF